MNFPSVAGRGQAHSFQSCTCWSLSHEQILARLAPHHIQALAQIIPLQKGLPRYLQSICPPPPSVTLCHITPFIFSSQDLPPSKITLFTILLGYNRSSPLERQVPRKRPRKLSDSDHKYLPNEYLLKHHRAQSNSLCTRNLALYAKTCSKW